LEHPSHEPDHEALSVVGVGSEPHRFGQPLNADIQEPRRQHRVHLVDICLAERPGSADGWGGQVNTATPQQLRSISTTTEYVGSAPYLRSRPRSLG
jgi:hypothetical protein